MTCTTEWNGHNRNLIWTGRLFSLQFGFFGTLLNHFIHDSKLPCFFCSHKKISFQCSRYLFDCLTSVTMIKTIKCISSPQYFSCMNLNITCLALRTPRWLMPALFICQLYYLQLDASCKIQWNVKTYSDLQHDARMGKWSTVASLARS